MYNLKNSKKRNIEDVFWVRPQKHPIRKESEKMNKINSTIAQELEVKESQVEAAVKLIDEGNTIPFIARYRKEATGGLSDETLRDLGERLTYLRNLEQRKEEVVKSIEEQGKLTDEIIQAVAISKTLAEVEDIYRPYKQKRKQEQQLQKQKD